MAGQWSSSLFASLWTETRSRSTKTQKKRRLIFSHIYQKSSVNKVFIMGQEFHFTTENPERTRWAYLARSCNQSEQRFRFMLPAHRAYRIIKGTEGIVGKMVIKRLFARYHLPSIRLTGYPQCLKTSYWRVCSFRALKRS